MEPFREAKPFRRPQAVEVTPPDSDSASPSMDSDAHVSSRSSASSPSVSPSEPGMADPLEALHFRLRDTSFSLLVPPALHPLLLSLQDAFLLRQSTLSETQQCQSSLELTLSFLDFICTAERATVASAVEVVLQAFHSEFLADRYDIHSLVAETACNAEERQRLLQIYYKALGASSHGDHCALALPSVSRSAFLSHVKCDHFQLMAVFGGQGDVSRTCVQELSTLFATYRPMLSPFVRLMSCTLRRLSQEPECARYYQSLPFDLETWLTDTTITFPPEFVSSAPVSVPVIGVLSLARYLVICQLLGLTPGELRAMFCATTGHSQGLLVAVAIALSESWKSFRDNCRLVVEALFWLGWDCHRLAPRSRVGPTSLSQGNRFKDDDAPSYMLSVRGLTQQKMESYVARMNKSLADNEKLYLALINAQDQFVIAGPVPSLVHLNEFLHMMDGSNNDQSRIPSRHRKPVIQRTFLPVSTPFHTRYLQQAAHSLKTRFRSREVFSQQLKIPVLHTHTGEDISRSNGNILHVAFDAIAQELCNWPAALKGPTTTHGAVIPPSHIIVFDGGGLAPLVKKIKEGQGVRIIRADELVSKDPEIGTIGDLCSPLLLETSTRLQSWSQRFQPRIANGALETRISRLLGTPPVIVAGMTPTTVHWDFVSAIMNAGYHAELAGGGHHNAAQMEAAIMALAADIPPGRGITCNVIYANPRALQWQIALLRRLSQKQIPIDGLTIGAGVPSPDIVAEYIQTLGLRHISFKPGSLESIRAVVDIAKAHPDFPIILQWTGGRGGGHHSFEDFHAPILKTYARVRQQPNIYLMAGSGFGTADSVCPYITGEWSVSLGYPPMPFDGVLLGSRMMVAQEAHTSPAVKSIIAKTPGVPDSEWEKTYGGSAGGIMTVQSEMGEPIHKIATRAVRFWAEMDKNVFKLPPKERLTYLEANREYIINRLNRDFAKPWFGRDSQGKVVDLKDMTYMEVLTRTVDLMYVAHQKRWIDASYIDFTWAIATRPFERYSTPSGIEKELSRTVLAEDPHNFLRSFEHMVPTAVAEILNPEDVSFFLIQTKKSGQKPVNFIPTLNEDFEMYFKKDSLWQSEDIEAVVDQDGERVCILHGPVAAQYTGDGGESAKDILDNIVQSLVDRIQLETSVDTPPTDLESGLMTPDSWATLSAFGRQLSLEEIPTPSTESDVHDEGGLFSASIGLDSRPTIPAWLRGLLGEKTVLRHKERHENPLRRFIEAFPDVIIHTSSDQKQILISCQTASRLTPSLRISCNEETSITVEVLEPTGSHPLRLLYQFKPNCNPFGLSEVMDGRNDRIRAFYNQVWFDGSVDPNMSIRDIFRGKEVTLTRDLIEKYIETIGIAFPDHRVIFPETDVMPIGVGIILAWDVIARPLVLNGIEGDLLRLVHRSNSFEYYSGAEPLCIGDTVNTYSQVQAVYIEDTGKTVVVEATITRSGNAVMKVTSTFFFRGSFKDFEGTFQHTKEPTRAVRLDTDIDEAVLLSRPWFYPAEDIPSLIGKTVFFDVDTHVTFQEDGGFSSLSVTGTARCQPEGYEWKQVGTVDFNLDECYGDPVIDFLERKGSLASRSTIFKNAGWNGARKMEIQMPVSNEAYAEVSRDLNPIHVSEVFTSLADVPGKLCHGMCTSAISATVLEHLGLDGDLGRLRRFSASFTSMVMPLETLVVEMKHFGMIDGRMRFTVRATRKENGEKVLEAEAEVEQVKTAYLFTGQGSQCQGMGMDLYSSSPLARALWDECDNHLFDAYGWSVLDIVRNNPKTLTIHFGGKQGRKIRQNYLDITSEVVQPDGSREQKPVLAGLTPTSSSYTFTDSRGLLYSTQFAQPAILLFEAAAFQDLREQGYVPEDAMYAGHSLGEYGALAALSPCVPTKALLQLAYYRGLMMQASVAGEGTAAFAMMAANPMRVGKFFNEASLSLVVRLIASESEQLLEIVNYNIEGEQYVCAGTTTNLYVLGSLLDHLAGHPDAAEQMQQAKDAPDAKTPLHLFIRDIIARAKALPQPIQLARGKATIPLEGIDVPFHSSHLRSTVDMFRQCLLKSGLFEGNVDVESLAGRWIPNLIGKPFSLDEAYKQEAFEVTQSPVYAEMLGRSS